MRTKLLTAAMAILCGCAQPYANFASEGIPSAVGLKGKTVATRIPEGASAMERNYQRIVNAELKRTGFNVADGNSKPQLLMNVSINREQKVTGFSTGPRFFGSNSEFTEESMMTVRLSLSQDGQTVWDGQMEGAAETLGGEYAGGCLRVLLELYDANHPGGMEYCYW